MGREFINFRQLHVHDVSDFFSLPNFSDPIKNFFIRKNVVFKTRGWGMGVATKAGLLATPQRGREQENARITRQGCSAP